MIYTATADDIITYRNDLTDIWVQSFDDTAEYVRFVLDNMPADVITIVYELKKHIIAAAYFWPMETYTGRKLVYEYAFAVHPRYRGCGIWREMSEYIYEYMTQHGMEVINYAEAHLREKYDEYGLKYHYEAYNIIITDKNKSSDTATNQRSIGREAVIKEKLTPHIHYERRENSGKANRIRYSEEFLKYLAKEKDYCSNIYDLITINGEAYYITGDIKDSELIIEETDIAPGTLIQYADLLFGVYDINCINVNYPPDADIHDVAASENSVIRRIYAGQGTVNIDDMWIPYTMR